MKTGLVSACLLGALAVRAVSSHSAQAFLRQGGPCVTDDPIDPNWDTPPSENSTANRIFDTVSSLLQRWPNTLKRNGHTIVPATIAPGTILYHGRMMASVPTTPDWLAFDFEHSHVFCQADCYVISLVTTRELRLAYFDGGSADKLPDGPMDSQDLVFWGRPMAPDRRVNDRERIQTACDWGKQFGLDGFVRMELHFEVMMCDFSNGLEVVSLLNLLPKERDYPYDMTFAPPTSESLDNQSHPREALLDNNEPKRPRPPMPDPPPPPEGWRGSLPSWTAGIFEVYHSGSWHDLAPGETRVHVEYSRVVTFYDESLTSLVDARRGVPHRLQRIANISDDDLARVMGELTDVLQRDSSDRGSGVDWGSVTGVVIKRYSDRLALLKYLLEPSTFQNKTEQAHLVRAQLLIMLSPYIDVKAVPAPDTAPSANVTWGARIVHFCSTTQTSHIRPESLNLQEKRIHGAVQGTLHEICRVLTKMWVDAIDVEEVAIERAQSLVVGWREQVGKLMEWLDWSVWVRCDPTCGPEEICYIPAWPFFPGDDPDKMLPRCMRRFAPFLDLLFCCEY